jgi:hypothetical protein
LSRYHSQCERRLHDNKTTSKQSLGLTTLDEIGATIGPLLIALVLLLNRSYQAGYALLVIPALLALASLVAVRIGFPLPARLEKGHAAQASGFTPSYWLYMLAGACFAAGLMSFELISYHLSGLTGSLLLPRQRRWASVGFGVVAARCCAGMIERSVVCPSVCRPRSHDCAR